MTLAFWGRPGEQRPARTAGRHTLNGARVADHGYPTPHSVAQVNPDHLGADLLVAIGDGLRGSQDDRDYHDPLGAGY